MLTGTISLGTVFASTGKLADRQMSDIVEYQTVNNTNLFETTPPGSVAQAGDSIKITNLVNANTGAISEFTQPVTRAFSLNKTDEIMGSFIFKLKADAANNSKHSLLFSILDPDVEGSKEVTVLIMDQAGKLGSQNPPSWTYTLDGPSRNYVKGTYYTVGFVLKNNYTYNIFINGEDIGTFSITNDDYRAMLDKMSKLKFKLTVHNGDNGAGNSAVFYMKDAVWQIGGGELVAELEKSSYSAGDTATVKFSAPLAGTIDTEAVKLYESATGVMVDGTSVTYENGEFKVTIPASIKSGAEYRIELPTVTDCIGNTLKNDNVYFNAAQGGDTYEIIDTYETFDSIGSGDYVAPTGWVMHSRAAANRGYSQKYVDSGNSTLKIGEEDTTSAWKQVGMYHNLNEKYTDGTVSISYDIKPLTANIVPRYDNYIPINIGLIGFSNAISGSVEIQSAALGGKVLAGTAGNKIGAPKGAAAANDHFASGEIDSKWYTAHTITAADFSKWFNVKVDLDLDAGNYTYYLDGQKLYDSPLSNLGLSDGISSIAFYISDRTKKSDQLIDNVKVSHITSKTLDTATTAFSDDFSGYVAHGYSAEEPYHNNLGTTPQNAWVPKGWGHAGGWGYNSQAAYMYPTTLSDSHGTVMDMQVLGAAEWNAPNLYHALDQKYTSGVVTVDYDINLKRIVKDTDVDFAALTYGDKNTNAFNMVLYSEKFTNEQLSIDDTTGYVDTNGSSKTDANNKKFISSTYGKKIFGIDAGQFSIYKDGNGNTYTTKKDATADTWYSVRHVIDIDNNSIKTYIGTTNDNLELLGVNNISDFTDDNFKDGIGGIGFSIKEKAYYANTYLDNISVTHSDFKSQKGVSAVRYSDYKDNIYGSSDSTTTLIDTIALAFTDAPNDIDGKVTITDSKDNSIGYESSFDRETNTYVMNLSEFLTAGETYTLTVEGVTFGGEAGETMDTYTHKIYAEANGEFIIEPMTISVNNDVKSTGTNIGKQQLASGNTVKADVRIINTTGQKKDFAFCSALYKDKMLDKFDYRTVTLDGKSTYGKSAELTCTFTTGTDASDITKVRTFLWNGMQEMMPWMESCDLDCSAE